jgi:LAS superfamily LD-carboxypeptidase LdcB
MKSFLTGKIVFFFYILALYSNQISDFLPEDILAGKYNPDQVKEFELVPAQYSLQRGIFINSQTLKSFIEMSNAAKKDGFNIFIISGVRSFSAQKAIWEGKFNGSRFVEGNNLKELIPDQEERALKILEYSSMPGTSRHHWGTDIDIGFNIKESGKMLSNEVYKHGQGKSFYRWMEEHSLKYGFCQPYKNSPENRKRNIQRGYQEEKWHWSYKPIAKDYLKLFIQKASRLKPSGFDGSSASANLYMDYVENIHKDCL